MAVSSTVLSSRALGCYRPDVRSKRWRVECKLSPVKPVTYSSKISTDVCLHESPQALFDEYMEDKPRVFAALFPDKPKNHRLNEEEWRVQMLPIKFLFLSAWPVVVMRLRCKSNGRDYPSDVPPDVTKVLELSMTRWELRGLDHMMEPSNFTIGVKGALYPDRRGRQTRLKGRLETNISVVLPSVLALVPEDVRRNMANAILTGLVDNMKHMVIENLVADYSKFKNERRTHN